MIHPLYINWNPNPELLNLFGISLRYYGLLWVVGIALAYVVVQRIYADRRIGQARFEPLFLYCFVGILVGARLGHCLFYDPTHYYISSLKGITEMLLPIQIQPDGGWKFTGYEGLASHGGTAGLMFTLWLYCRKYRMHYIDVVDMIAVATPITACCIRLANLMNSEIIGMPTTMPWGFVFERVTHLNGAAIPLEPRHPAQLYEALAYFALFIIMMVLYSRGMKAQGVERPLRSKLQADDAKTVLDLGRKRGFYFGLCLTYIFTFRFFIEFLKENQGAFEDAMTFNMGQLLSLPFVAIGVYFMGFYGRKHTTR